MVDSIHVAVGVIVNDRDEVLVSYRPENKDQGGLWEFPGGKKEKGETIESALEREFLEEIGIQLESYSPMLKIKHDYKEYSVILDVWMITEYSKIPLGAEGQTVEWRKVQSLNFKDFPEANKKIIRLLKLHVAYRNSRTS
ncbi:MAG: 8-oxo-dGTP diphosphatase MutT [Pseudohongiellaceae bacterium]